MKHQTSKRRFAQSIDVERHETEHGVAYVSFAPHGRSVVSRTSVPGGTGPFFSGSFFDLADVQYGLSPSGAKITFEAFEKGWNELPSQELPTTPADRDYRGFDYLRIEKGRLVAIKDEGADEATVEVTSYEQWLHIAAVNDRVLFSSSVDFVEQETLDKDVIALAQRIRG